MKKKIKALIVVIALLTIFIVFSFSVKKKNENILVKKYYDLTKNANVPNENNLASIGTTFTTWMLANDNSKYAQVVSDNNNLKDRYNLVNLKNIIEENLNKVLGNVTDVSSIMLTNKVLGKGIYIPMDEVYRGTGLVSDYKYLKIIN